MPLAVPVIVSVAFVGGLLPPPQPLKPDDAANIANPISAPTQMMRLLAKSLRATSNGTNRQSSTSAPNATGKPGMPGKRTNGMPAALEVFDTLTRKAEPLVPLSASVAGDTEQVADIGAPVQVRATEPLNPLFGVTCRL